MVLIDNDSGIEVFNQDVSLPVEKDSAGEPLKTSHFFRDDALPYPTPGVARRVTEARIVGAQGVR